MTPRAWFDSIFTRPHGGACEVWPYAKTNGYGVIAIDYTQHRVHRVVLTRYKGPAPADRPQAAHSCGNRACVNPNHLRWASAVENAADRDRHGTTARFERAGSGKLTAADVAFVLASPLSARLLAERFGVHRSQIYRIRTGSRWAPRAARAAA